MRTDRSVTTSAVRSYGESTAIRRWELGAKYKSPSSSTAIHIGSPSVMDSTQMMQFSAIDSFKKGGGIEWCFITVKRLDYLQNGPEHRSISRR